MPLDTTIQQGDLFAHTPHTLVKKGVWGVCFAVQNRNSSFVTRRVGNIQHLCSLCVRDLAAESSDTQPKSSTQRRLS